MGKDSKGLFVRSTAIARDARAPCFEHDEKFYSCPVAMATRSQFTHAAFKWHARSEKGLMATLAPMDKLPALVLQAVDEVRYAIGSKESWELEKIERKRKRK